MWFVFDAAACIVLLLGLRKGMTFNIVSAVLLFGALAFRFLSGSGGFSFVDLLVVLSLSFGLVANGVIIGIKKSAIDRKNAFEELQKKLNDNITSIERENED